MGHAPSARCSRLLNQPIMRLPEYPITFPYSFYPEVFIITPFIHLSAAPDPCRGALGRLWLGRRFCDVARSVPDPLGAVTRTGCS
jgi:hypothetical protein